MLWKGESGPIEELPELYEAVLLVEYELVFGLLVDG